MLRDIYIIDNVFSNPEEVVRWAESFDYLENDSTTTFWKGRRSKVLRHISKEIAERSNLLVNEIIHSCFLNSYEDYKYEFSWGGETCFHRLDKNCVFDNTWIHKDPNCIYAGVVYLNKDPLVNSGTMIYRQDNSIEYVENVYNRLVLYKSCFKHSAMGGFGERENSRLTFTLFLSKLEVKIVNNSWMER